MDRISKIVKSYQHSVPLLHWSILALSVIAGLLIIPAMYVALANGVEIYTEAGELIAGDSLIFTVLPALFDTMGAAGSLVAFVFSP